MLKLTLEKGVFIMEKIIDVKELPSRKFLTRTQGGHSIYLLENASVVIY